MGQHSWKAFVQMRDYITNVLTNVKKKRRYVQMRVSMPRGHVSTVIATAHFTKLPAMDDVLLIILILGSYHARLTR